jgi:hypothetical protein
MTQQLVILVGNDQWRVLHMKARQCELRVFSASDDGQQLLLDWLRQHTAATVYFLTDIADEHYHVEVLPHVGRTATKQLLTRRLAAWPFAQGLHAVHKVGTLKGLRKEDRYLFSAIHSVPLRDCLQAMQKQALRVQGVYTQALCLPCLHAHLHPAEPQCCYVYYANQQLRIRYLYQSRLLFSRLITLAPDDSIHARILNEIAQTRLYLISQHWLQETQSLKLFWLNEDATASDLAAEQLPAGIKLACLTYADVHRHFGWRAVPQGLNTMDWAAVQVMLSTRQLPNFAPPAVLINKHIAHAKRKITTAGGLMLGLFIMISWISQQCMESVQLTLHQGKQNLRHWQGAKPDWQFSYVELRRIQSLSQAVQGLGSSTSLPDHALAVLQSSISGLNIWQVKEIEWRYGPAQEPFSLAGSDWIQTVTITFSQKENTDSSNVRQEWQSLLEKLRQHPDIVELTEVNAAPASGNAARQGDTQGSSMPVVQTLKIKLRSWVRVAA